MDPDKVATYFATVKLLALVHFVYFSVKAGAAQRYSELMHTHDHDQLAQFATRHGALDLLAVLGDGDRPAPSRQAIASTSSAPSSPMAIHCCSFW